MYAGCSSIVHISKELFHWGDTYTINILNSEDEIPALMLVIAIDAANCTQENKSWNNESVVIPAFSFLSFICRLSEVKI